MDPLQDTLRTFQSYLVKMPQAAVDLFPGLRAAVQQAAAPSSDVAGVALTDLADAAMQEAAGKAAGRAGGQGFQVDQQVKAAVEAHAMNAATDYYAGAWSAEDVHGRQSYDLACRRGSEVRHVEVKAPRQPGPTSYSRRTRPATPGRTRTPSCSSSPASP